MHNIFSLFFILFLGGCSKTITPDSIIVDGVVEDIFQITKIATLPSVLDESSGLEITNDALLWSHNDHNGKAELYGFDDKGNLSKTLSIGNANNEDWEDLAQDKNGNLYIGDFGNNDNDRQDLKIYKVKAADFGQNNNINSEVIRFQFEDQTDFPPPEEEHFFDVEAFISQGDFLYLFIKDRSKPFIGKTKLYRIPNTTGSYTATLIGEWLTDSKKNKGQITAADISPNGETLALLSNEVVWLFNDFTGTNFFSGKVERLDLPYDVQMEGLVFKDDCTLYLSNEHKSDEASSLYELIVCK